MSLRHIVLFSLSDGVSPADPRVVAAVEVEGTLSAAIPEGRDWRFGPNVSGRSVAPEFVGVADFDTTEDLQRFLAHPAHQEAAALWADIATWVVADLDLGAGAAADGLR